MEHEGVYDAIVVGVGGMGSATCYQLARRGLRVLGLERFDIPHAMGSSHGYTRIIRLAYYEHPSYVPLLRRAYELWEEIEARVGEQLLVITGALEGGQEESPIFQGALRSAMEHGLAHEVLDGAEVSRRFPAFELPREYRVLLEPRGGYLLPERCIVAFVLAAQAHGARIQARETVLGFEPTAGGGVRVRTERGEYEAGSLVITAGAWSAPVMPFLRSLAVPQRQVLGWFQPADRALFTPERFPVFLLDVPEGFYYGFPEVVVPGFKVGRYHHLEEKAEADGISRVLTARDEEVLRNFAERYVPQGAGPTMALSTCIFTNSPDEHFIVDRHPEFPQVSFAAGFSGHGFKFASVMGEILADLAEHGATSYDIDLFRVARFGVGEAG